MSRAGVTSGALAFTAGYVDTVGFIMLFGLFTAHVTGNFVLIGSELAHPTDGVALKLLAFPAFIAAVAASRLLALAVERRGRSSARALLQLQIVLLAAFVDLMRGVADAALRDRIGKLFWPVLAFGCGAISGALACQRIALWALALPLAVLSGLALTSSSRH
jgi:uncharacterized membrane protein YoaK (UPF0700 family)